MNILEFLKKNGTQRALLFLLILFIFQMIFISPFGEFALNDDWVHTWSAKHLADTGELAMMPWAGATFYTPILYGAGLIKIFGFSFSLLRISTLSLSFLFLLLLFFVLKKYTQRNSLALIGTLTLWLNPIFFNLSYTFMTDIPALLLIFVSFLLFSKAMEKGEGKSWIWFFFGTLISIIGFYTRQTNILLIIPFGLYALFRSKEHGGLMPVLTSFGIPILAGAGAYYFLFVNKLLPVAASTHFFSFNLDYLKHIILWVWQYTLIAGISLFPVSIGLVKWKTSIKNPKFILLLLGTGVLSLYLNYIFSDRLWHIGNVVHALGIGPSLVINGFQTELIDPIFQKLLTLFGALSLSTLSWLLFQRQSAPDEFKGGKLNLALWFCFLYSVTVVSVRGFDRYMLPVILILILFVLRKFKEIHFSILPTAIVLLLFLAISWSQTHHYLVWNKTRWELASKALEIGVAAETIEAGYEWDGWNNYWFSLEAEGKEGSSTSPWWIRQLFPDNTEEYIVSFSTLPGYEIMEERKMQVLNPNNKLFLLHRTEE
ncbi:MAG: glycosyltransferase family 39 protein [Candidatus Magasanikbacteria bacterium]